MLLRPQDQLRAFELHPTEQKILRTTLAATPGAIAYDGDGFAGLKSQLPPSSRRAAVLIDPSYEGNGDYAKVVATLREALERFAPGVYMVWHPLVSKLAAAGCRAARGARAQGLAACPADRAAARRAGLRPRRQRHVRAQPAA
jgi:23S rRNA (adenine2030-N6)-methyltransferase